MTEQRAPAPGRREQRAG